MLILNTIPQVVHVFFFFLLDVFVEYSYQWYSICLIVCHWWSWWWNFVHWSSNLWPWSWRMVSLIFLGLKAASLWFLLLIFCFTCRVNPTVLGIKPVSCKGHSALLLKDRILILKKGAKPDDHTWFLEVGVLQIQPSFLSFYASTPYITTCFVLVFMVNRGRVGLAQW